MRKRTSRPESWIPSAEVAGRLSHPGTVEVAGDTEDVDDAAFHFDHEQNLVAAEHHAVDGEGIGRNDALGLSSEELGPGWTCSPWRGGNPMLSQDVGDAPLETVTPSFFKSPAMHW